MYGASVGARGARVAKAITAGVRLESSRVGRKKAEFEAFAQNINDRATELGGAMQEVRDNLPPQVYAYFDQVREILFTGDAYARALGATFGDWRDTSPSVGLATPTYLSYCRQAKSWIDWLRDSWYVPSAWSFPEIRGHISDVVGSYTDLSTAMWTANGEISTVFNGAVELYDTGEELRRISGYWLSAPLSVMASDICRDYLTHSGYRRLKQDREPGVHPRWTEVCDLWVNDYDRGAGTWGTEFKWPREDDPGYRPMPSSMRIHAHLLEEGCLPWEVCSYNVERAGLRSSLISKLDLAPDVRNLVTGYTIDNVFDTADALALDVKQLLTELISHLTHISGLVSGSIIPNSTERDILDTLSGTRQALRSYRSQLQELRDLGDVTKSYWRGSGFATSWRGTVVPKLEQAVLKANDIEDTINSSEILGACDYVYPKKSVRTTARAKRARKSYWEAQGVPSRCVALTTGSYVPYTPPDLPRPEQPGTPGFQTWDGRGTDREFGSLQPESQRIMGLLPWQALALIAGAWFLWPEKTR